MKTKLVLILAVSGLLAVVPHAAFAADPEDEEIVAPLNGPDHTSPPPPAAGGAEFRHWHQGEPPIKLIRKEEGFCALTGVGGGFQGGGEEAHVYIGDDGYWYLGGKSMQKGVSADCVVVRYPLAPPTVAKRVDILAASYSFGSEYADVTARVKTLLHAGKTFQANPAALLTDPHPGWNKALVIFCKVDGKRAIFSVGEDELVSHELLAEKARRVVYKIQAPKNLH